MIWSDPSLLAGQTAIVTGGTRGIGLAVTQALFRAGANVLANYRTDETGAELLRKEWAGQDDRFLICRGSVCDSAFVASMSRAALDKWGRIDCLVNNAGITRDIHFSMMTENQWDEVMETNAKGAFLCTKRVIKPMAARRAGSIINISSQAATHGRAGQVNYSASKAALLGFTRALAREVGRYQIRVNAIVVGVVDTDMTQRLPGRILDGILENTPLGRMGRPDEIANLVLFLASDLSSFITGSCLEIAGGL